MEAQVIELQKNDVIQIVNETNRWFPCLLIVDEVKPWGVTAYALWPVTPPQTPENQPAERYPLRVPIGDFVLIGPAAIGIED